MSRVLFRCRVGGGKLEQESMTSFIRIAALFVRKTNNAAISL